MDVKLRVLELGLLLVLGANVVCLYGLVRTLWQDLRRRRIIRAVNREVHYDPLDDYGETLRRLNAQKGVRPREL